ncbi:MAG: tetratricopeptide repeat protein [Candidatus Cloacimonetes bacterium]|nr:tetratricopeptide repeat protein [Candidatus Cloacimonadota bacterium]
MRFYAQSSQSIYSKPFNSHQATTPLYNCYTIILKLLTPKSIVASLFLFNFLFLHQTIARNISYPILSPNQLQIKSPQLESAYQSILSQDFPSAKHKLNSLLQSDERPQAIYYLSHVYLRLDQMDRAHDQLGRLKSYPSFQSIFTHAEAVYDSNLAWYFLRRKRWTKAFDLFQKASSSQNTEDILEFISSIYLDRTKFWKRGRDLKNKINLLKSSVKINPKHEETLQILTKILTQKNEYSEAEPYLELLVEHFSTKQRRLELAQLYTYTNKVRIAAKIYRTLHNQYPNDRFITTKYNQTIDFLKLNSETNWDPSSLEIDNSTRTQMQSFQKLLLDKNYKEAEALLENLIEHNPNDWKFRQELISLYRLQKQYQKALDTLQPLGERFGNSYQYQYQKALCLEKLDSKQGISFVKDQLLNPELSPEQSYPYQEILAKLYLKTGNLELAREILMQLVQIDYPTKHVANFYYGVYFSQIRFFQKSLEYYHLAYDEQGSNPKYLLALATTLRQLGHQEKSKIYYLKLVNSFPGSQYVEYAKKLFPNVKINVDDHQNTDNTPAYLKLFYSITQKQNNLTLTKTLELLKQTHQWDLLIQYLEYALQKNPEQPEYKSQLENLYKNYTNLDFSYQIDNSYYIEEIEKMHIESRDDELDLFYRHLNPHVSITPEIRTLIAKYLLEAEFFEIPELIYQSLLDDGPHKIQYYSQLGYLYFTQKRFSEALNAYYQALNLNPANSTILFKLAELLRTTGELQKSQLIYQEIINLNLSSQSVEDAQFYLRQLNLEINSANGN